MMKPPSIRTAGILLAGLLVCACAGPRRKQDAPVVKAGALSGSKIEVRTIDNPDAHESQVTLGLLAFQNNSSDQSLDSMGTTLADLVSVQLASANGIKVVERQRIKDLEKEMSLGDTGPVDQATAVRIGGMLGANVIAFGSFSKLGGEVLLTMRLVKVETSEIIGGVTERGKSINDLDALAGDAATKLAQALSAK